ncbi:alpha/beta-hydrolase [Amylocystis lapponica]|nr:alpha/beta-hydrolase [Amylocystis lapponica]KAH9943855.1 alpha/beta-hydrolase [Amylocystis lapponica]
MSFCKDCIAGVIHEGTPEGKIEQIGGIECYVATPTIDYPKDKVVLLLTDVFGLTLVNNKLLADAFAQNGFKVVVPDILEGGAISEEVMNSGKFDFMSWRPKHTETSWRPIVDAVVGALKADGVTRFGATGYCFGAPPALYLAYNNTSHATVLAHPSLLKIPDDFEKYREVSKVPLLINSCEVDSQFPPDLQAVTDGLLGGGKFAPGYERLYWDGCTHGFAVRGDMSDPKVKAGNEGAFKATVEWFIKYL